MQQTIGKYTVGSKNGLNELQLKQLQRCLEQPAAEAKGTLAGRAGVATLALADQGTVVVKHYTRGGFIRTFNYNSYLKTSSYRCKEEFDILSTLYKAGVNVPEPVAYVFTGKLLYNAWLVTQEIENAQTLVEISTTNPQQLQNLMSQLKEQVRLLVEHRVYHVDLHPGNVLTGADRKIYIIDFDKASTFSGSANDLWKKYTSRWQRALNKHQLTEVLTLSRQ